MKALSIFAPLFARRARAMALTLVLSLITLAAGIGLLGTSGWFITATALTTLGLGFNLFVPSSLVRAFSFIRILSRYGEKLVGHDATLRLLSDLRGWLFAALFPRLPLPDRSLRHGDLVSRLTADVDALDTSFLVAVGPWLSAIVVGSVMSVVLAFLLPGAAWIYGLAMAAAIFVVPTLLVMAGRFMAREAVEALAEMRMSVLDAVSGHADLVLLGARGSAAQRLADASESAARFKKRLGALTAGAGMAVQSLAALALAGTLWAGLTAVTAGDIDGPVMAGLLLAVIGSFEVTGMIVRSVGKAAAALAAAERLDALTQLPSPVAEPATALAIPPHASIVFENVHFAYDGYPPVLDGLDLTVVPGERIAIAGASGTGKSTLLKLLLRLTDPRQGRILLGDVPLTDLRAADIHAHMALLSQDSPVFIDTIRDNLIIARPTANEDELWTALAKARLDDFVRSLPKGLDTVLGEAGRTLSAGQARRLCLARALLSDAPILLLDEPTNALDRETELAFFETLAEATTDRTVITITHAALPEGSVDRVLTLKAGRLVEA